MGKPIAALTRPRQQKRRPGERRGKKRWALSSNRQERHSRSIVAGPTPHQTRPDLRRDARQRCLRHAAGRFRYYRTGLYH